MTYFQIKNNNNTFIESYVFNDKAPVISLWIYSGCGQIALMLWSDHTGCAIWSLGDLTCNPVSMSQSVNYKLLSANKCILYCFRPKINVQVIIVKKALAVGKDCVVHTTIIKHGVS